MAKPKGTLNKQICIYVPLRNLSQQLLHLLLPWACAGLGWGQSAAGMNQNSSSLNLYFLIFLSCGEVEVIGNQPVAPFPQDGGSVSGRVLRYTTEDPAVSCPSLHFR